MSQVNKPPDSQEIVSQSQVLVNKDKHFIEDKIFEKLLEVREEIYQKTDVNVSPRKLVNMLLEQSDFKALSHKLIEQYS